MQFFRDLHGRSVRLTEERLLHFQTEHPEMAEQLSRLSETLAAPDRIIRSRTDETVELFYRHYSSTPVTSKFLCIVIKAVQNDAFIITAYYTDTVKKGEILWDKR